MYTDQKPVVERFQCSGLYLFNFFINLTYIKSREEWNDMLIMTLQK